MDVAAIASLFTGEGAVEAARRYLAAQGLLDLIESVAAGEPAGAEHSAGAEHPAGAEAPARIPPEFRDLARLHQVLRQRRVFTALEFGVGFSTLVMADALLKNRQDWRPLQPKPRTRHQHPFALHAVDTAPDWIARTRALLPEPLSGAVTFHATGAAAGTFQDRACHYYTRLPDVVPDFILLDGPDPADVAGEIGGLTWQNPDRCVMAGDMLRMEPHLLPGTLLLVDGRRANALFLAAHFYRRWAVQYNPDSDLTVMELQDPPLGAINRETLRYCLGERALAW
ncbi:MAG: hypothetical protein JXN59_04955 [Anaerolineae bacterium]|nr:hypothetical protein [Anaerolineae bacterium]